MPRTRSVYTLPAIIINTPAFPMHKSSAFSQPLESKGCSTKAECKSGSYHTVRYIKHILSTVKDWTRVMKRSHNVKTTDKQRSKGLATGSRPTLLLRGDRRGWAWTGGVYVRRRCSKNLRRVQRTGTPAAQVSVGRRRSGLSQSLDW